jgi:hypothetical protein
MARQYLSRMKIAVTFTAKSEEASFQKYKLADHSEEEDDMDENRGGCTAWHVLTPCIIDKSGRKEPGYCGSPQQKQLGREDKQCCQSDSSERLGRFEEF